MIAHRLSTVKNCDRIFEISNGKLINIHPSILPKYPGLNTHEKVLLSDDKHHGVTIHYVNENYEFELDQVKMLSLIHI
mgnify:CR=1 FL=1